MTGLVAQEIRREEIRSRLRYLAQDATALGAAAQAAYQMFGNGEPSVSPDARVIMAVSRSHVTRVAKLVEELTFLIEIEIHESPPASPKREPEVGIR